MIVQFWYVDIIYSVLLWFQKRVFPNIRKEIIKIIDLEFYLFLILCVSWTGFIFSIKDKLSQRAPRSSYLL